MGVHVVVDTGAALNMIAMEVTVPRHKGSPEEGQDMGCMVELAGQSPDSLA